MENLSKTRRVGRDPSLTEAQENAIIEDYRSGIVVRSIMGKHDVTNGLIYSILRRRNIPLGSKQPDTEEQ